MVILRESEHEASGSAQRDTERFACATLDALSEHVAVLDEQGTIVAVNRAWREFAGSNSFCPESLIEGANYFATCDRATGEDERDAARFAAGLRAVINGELNEFSFEYPCHSPTEQRWFIARATRFELDAKICAVVTHSNITSRKLTEQRLAQSEGQLRAIFEASRDGLLVENGETIFYSNRAYAHMLGYDDPDELVGRHVSSVVASEDAGRMFDYGLLRLAGMGTPPTVYEFKGMCKDGSLVDLEASVSTHTIAGKIYITTAVRDISERKLAEEARRRSESRYRLLMEQASDGIHTYDLHGNFIEVNSQFCEMLGYTCEELLQLNIKDLIPAEDIAHTPIRFDELQDGKSLLVERRLRRKDGMLLPVEISGRMIQEGVLQAIVRDISKRKQVEQALHKAYDELERRVEERTAELARANATLKAEAAERQQAEESRRRLVLLLVTAQEEERRRISRELHDQMGQQLAALMMGLKTLDGESYGRQSALATLQRLQGLTYQLSHEAHALAWGLRPPALDELGLHTALYNYIEEWAKRSRVPVDFHSSGFEVGRLPFAHETALYRIGQEALTNILKHSGADRVSFILERRGDHVLVVVEDNGKGFEVEAAMGLAGKEHRLGLLGMRERAALLGGTLNVESAPGAGTSVFVRIPVGAGREEGHVGNG